MCMYKYIYIYIYVCIDGFRPHTLHTHDMLLKCCAARSILCLSGSIVAISRNERPNHNSK